MEDSAKKAVLITIIVVCLAAAGVITYMTMGGGGTGGGKIDMVWVKCNNPSCGHEYQMSPKEYSDLVYKNDPRAVMMYGAQPLKCPKCGENSVFAAIKCEKCGKVFFPGTVEGQFDDKCTGCGYSKKEEMSKRTAPARQ
jgi:phage FluMu protein Com